jgi:predicted nucleic acid-binding protein
VSRNWVVNASPLILLAKVGRLDLLPTLANQLVVPASVMAEVQAGPAADPLAVV